LAREIVVGWTWNFPNITTKLYIYPLVTSLSQSGTLCSSPLISSYSLIYARKKLKINNYEDSLTNQQLKKDFWVQYQEKRRKKKNLSELGEEDVPLIEGFFFFFFKKEKFKYVYYTFFTIIMHKIYLFIYLFCAHISYNTTNLFSFFLVPD
jgi:hypothetical protein